MWRHTIVKKECIPVQLQIHALHFWRCGRCQCLGFRLWHSARPHQTCFTAVLLMAIRTTGPSLQLSPGSRYKQPLHQTIPSALTGQRCSSFPLTARSSSSIRLTDRRSSFPRALCSTRNSFRLASRSTCSSSFPPTASVRLSAAEYLAAYCNCVDHAHLVPPALSGGASAAVKLVSYCADGDMTAAPSRQAPALALTGPWQQPGRCRCLSWSRLPAAGCWVPGNFSNGDPSSPAQSTSRTVGHIKCGGSVPLTASPPGFLYI